MAGERYVIKTLGERVPLSSEYPNIIAIDGLLVADDGSISWE